jgi:hypothetical protein
MTAEVTSAPIPTTAEGTAARIARQAAMALRRTAASSEIVVDFLWIVVCGAAVALVLQPFQDTPYVDDWTYAWSVEHLLAGRGLAILAWSSNLNFAQILWGALFCIGSGFSFVALRMSTWSAALLGLFALRALLRELGVGRADAWLGVMLLAVNPVFFMLSATFMTDVPFLAASLWATFALVAAIARRSDRWLVLFALLAVVASAVRVVAVALPVAAVLALWLHSGSWGRDVRRLAVAAAPLACFALLVAWGEPRMVHIGDLVQIAGSAEFRTGSLVTALFHLPKFLLQAILCAAGSLGIALLPLAVAQLDARSAWRALPFVGALLALACVAAVCGIDWPAPLSPTFVWTYGELGGTESLVAGKSIPYVPHVLTGTVTVVGMLAAALVLGTLRRRVREAESVVAWSLAGQVGLVAIFWLFYDRYLLALLPLLIVLVLGSRVPLRRARMVAVLGVFAVVSLLGVRDHLAYNAALWRGVALLHDQGVRDADIDGGYVVDGWLQFARPEHAPRDADDHPFFPWLTARGGLLPYQIANRPLPEWLVLDEIPYRRWLGRSGAIYVLARAR